MWLVQIRFYGTLKAEVDDELSKTPFSDRRIPAIISSAASVFTSTGAISDLWKPKSEWEDKNPNAVWRIERIKYAASTYVKDKDRANTLVAQAEQILSVYNVLNKAHTRGAIDQNIAIQAVRSMKLFLEDRKFY